MSTPESCPHEYVSPYVSCRLIGEAPVAGRSLPISVTSRPLRAAFLAPREALRLANAMLFAERQGRWLNALMTIAWKSRTGRAFSGPEELQLSQADLLHRLKRLTRRNGWPLFCAWAKENGRVGSRVGVHSHLFLHLPPKDWRVGRDLLTTEAQRLLAPVRACAIDFRGDRTRDRPGFRSRVEMRRQVIYGIKSLAPNARCALSGGQVVAVREYLQLREAAERAGMTANIDPVPAPWHSWGKAAGCSESLGPQARRAAGWVELTTLDHLRDAIWLGYSPLNDAREPPQPWRRGAVALPPANVARPRRR